MENTAIARIKGVDIDWDRDDDNTNGDYDHPAWYQAKLDDANALLKNPEHRQRFFDFIKSNLIEPYYLPLTADDYLLDDDLIALNFSGMVDNLEFYIANDLSYYLDSCFTKSGKNEIFILGK